MASHTTTQTSRPQNNTKAFPPLKLWQEIHCKNCTLNHQKHCYPAAEAYQNCILAHLTLELQQLRILIQQRTQHQSW